MYLYMYSKVYRAHVPEETTGPRTLNNDKNMHIIVSKVPMHNIYINSLDHNSVLIGTSFIISLVSL